MKDMAFRIIVVIVLVGAPWQGQAWGPSTQLEVVTTAARVISADRSVLLVNLLQDIQKGALAGEATVAGLFPAAEGNLVGAIESEMQLLQGVRGRRVDPYFAYRLGMLGKVVARAAAPMANADPVYRARYYADVDANIGMAVLRSAPRRRVDPQVYFAELQREARLREEVIQKDYEAGIGFSGMAQGALSEDMSRSVDAVADVWHTIMTGPSIVASISESQMREYGLSALEFYLERGNMKEVQVTYNRLITAGRPTPDFRKRVGDVFFDAEQYERAIQEYEAVFEQDMTRRDVIEKIASYYVQVGDEALAAGRLEPAEEAYAHAARVDRLHPTAPEKRLKAAKLIEQRDQRLQANRDTLEAAQSLEERAVGQMRMREYAAAFQLLTEAETLYKQVTTEFEAERRSASLRLNKVAALKRQLRDELINDAERLSGSGTGGDAKALAADASRELGGDILRALTATEYQAVAESVGQDLQDSAFR